MRIVLPVQEIASQTWPGIFSAVDDESRLIPAVEFRHIKLSFDDHIVLDDVSFKVGHGELLVILGSSGCGKSTVLRLAIGLLKPDEGQVLIDGEDITNYEEEDLNRVRKKMGMDFQAGALFDSLSVYDNVAFRGQESRMPEDRVDFEVHRALRFVDLEDAIDMMPAELSGGMRIRVGLARALIGEPHIVFMDEPTAGLDPPTARTICELGILLRDLRDVSIIFVTHGVENLRFLASSYAFFNSAGEVVLEKEGDRLCLTNTKIMILREGRVFFYGSDEELFNSQDAYIQDFLLV
jgi:phospholipid/cholesterol/gamma-HCH transport system ATP-binding protein